MKIKIVSVINQSINQSINQQGTYQKIHSGVRVDISLEYLTAMSVVQSIE